MLISPIYIALYNLANDVNLLQSPYLFPSTSTMEWVSPKLDHWVSNALPSHADN